MIDPALRKYLYRFIQLEASQPRTSDEFPSDLTVWRKASWVDFDRSWMSFHDCIFLNIMHGELDCSATCSAMKPVTTVIK